MIKVLEEDKELAEKYINRPSQETQPEVKNLSKEEYKDAETAFLQECEDMCFASGKSYSEVFEFLIQKPRHRAFAEKNANRGY